MDIFNYHLVDEPTEQEIFDLYETVLQNYILENIDFNVVRKANFKKIVASFDYFRSRSLQYGAWVVLVKRNINGSICMYLHTPCKTHKPRIFALASVNRMVKMTKMPVKASQQLQIIF